MITIHIPTPLRAYTEKNASVLVSANTVQEALDALLAQYPALGKHLIDPQGKLRSFINIYLGDEDIRFLEQTATELTEGDELSIIPSIAGGAYA